MGAENVQLKDIIKDNELSLREAKKLGDALKNDVTKDDLVKNIQEELNTDKTLQDKTSVALHDFFLGKDGTEKLSGRVNTFSEVGSLLHVISVLGGDKKNVYKEQLTTRFDEVVKREVDRTAQNGLSSAVSLSDLTDLKQTAKDLGVYSDDVLKLVASYGVILKSKGVITQEDFKKAFSDVSEEKKSTTEEGKQEQKKVEEVKLQEKAKTVLNSSEIVSKTLFEKITEPEFNAVFDRIYAGLDADHNISSGAEGEDLQFYKMVADYAKPDSIWDDQILLSKDDGTQYKKDTNLVKFFVAEPIKKESFKAGDPDYKQDGDKYYKKSTKESVFLRGSQNHVQESRSESVNANFAKEAFKKTPDFSLLDDRGTYKTFEKVIKEDPTFLTNNLPTIMNQLKLYKPGETTADFKELVNIKNGYADVLTSAIIDSKDSELMKSYLTYLSPENSVYLGNDKATQSKNFKALMASPLYKQVLPTLDENTKNNILNLGLSIERMDQPSLQEAMKSGMDSLIKTFGPMLLSVVEFFGGKGALKKFCSQFGVNYDKYFDQFEKLYKDEYSLNKDQSKLLKDVFKEHSAWNGEDKDIRDAKGNVIPYNKKAIQESYKNSINKENFSLLDPQLVAKTMKDLNYTNSDVVTLVKDGGKEKWVINPKNSLTDAQMTAIVSTIVENPSVWKSIQSAGISMASDAVYSADATKDPVGNKQAEQMKQMKGLTTAEDIGMYFGLYLMKGSKDLKYAVSENDLPNKKYKEGEIDNQSKQQEEAEQIKAETKELTDFSTKLSGEWKDLPKKGDKLSVDEIKKNDAYINDVATNFDSFLKTDSPYSKILIDPSNSALKTSYESIIKNNIVSYLAKKNPSDAADKTLVTKIGSIVSTDVKASIDSAGIVKISGKNNANQNVEVSLSDFTWLKKESEPQKKVVVEDVNKDKKTENDRVAEDAKKAEEVKKAEEAKKIEEAKKVGEINKDPAVITTGEVKETASAFISDPHIIDQDNQSLLVNKKFTSQIEDVKKVNQSFLGDIQKFNKNIADIQPLLQTEEENLKQLEQSSGGSLVDAADEEMDQSASINSVDGVKQTINTYKNTISMNQNSLRDTIAKYQDIKNKLKGDAPFIVELASGNIMFS